MRSHDNLIEEVADALPSSVAGVPEGLGARNVDATFNGLEVALRVMPFRWLIVSGSYTYLAFDTGTGTLLNRSRHHGSAAVTLRDCDRILSGDRITATVLGYIVGSRDSANPFYAEQPFTPSRLAAQGRADLALAYQRIARISWEFDIRRSIGLQQQIRRAGAGALHQSVAGSSKLDRALVEATHFGGGDQNHDRVNIPSRGADVNPFPRQAKADCRDCGSTAINQTRPRATAAWC